MYVRALESFFVAFDHDLTLRLKDEIKGVAN